MPTDCAVVVTIVDIVVAAAVAADSSAVVLVTLVVLATVVTCFAAPVAHVMSAMRARDGQHIKECHKTHVFGTLEH